MVESLDCHNLPDSHYRQTILRRIVICGDRALRSDKPPEELLGFSAQIIPYSRKLLDAVPVVWP